MNLVFLVLKGVSTGANNINGIFYFLVKFSIVIADSLIVLDHLLDVVD